MFFLFGNNAFKFLADTPSVWTHIVTSLLSFCYVGYDMSTFIRRYSRYLNEKAVSYRQVAFDFTKVKRG